MASNTATALIRRGFKSIGFWRLLAVLFALLNLKHIPFGWHLRIFTGLLTHIPYLPFPLRLRQRTNPKLNPSNLFAPILLSSRAQLPECDYNIHKSNSTYFADFDIARMHLLTRLFPPGLVATSRDLYREAGNTGPKRLGIYLGGVSCNFRREIGVYQEFEMWTRVLCWDRKWLYVVTHFLRKDVVRPRGFALQPWKNSRQEDEDATSSARAREVAPTEEEAEEMKKERRRTKPLFFATAVAKYVCKRGRLTIAPDLVLRNSGLLPPGPRDREKRAVSTATPSSARPEEPTHSPSVAPHEKEEEEGGGDATTALPATAAVADLAQDLSSGGADDLLDAALDAAAGGGGGGGGAGAGGGGGGEEWTWERVEAERRRGMKIMEAWNQTEALDEEFTGHEAEALGEYWDFP
ncbi:MAG: hypothetical protein Q9202_003278 [Teloschistes flavicans]